MISSFNIKIKTVSTNEFIYTATTNVNDLTAIKASLKASFTINLQDNVKLKPGQYYKIQIAYCDMSGTPGYYSTIGIVKLTTKPKVTIANLSGYANEVVASKLTYTGVYQQYSTDSDINMDVSEKVNEYCFNLYAVGDNGTVTLAASSGWLLHNSSTDIVSYESTDQYSFTYSLKANKYYQVEYVVRTINGLEQSSGRYVIMEKIGIKPEIEANFNYSVDFDNGYIDLYFTPYNSNQAQPYPINPIQPNAVDSQPPVCGKTPLLVMFIIQILFLIIEIIVLISIDLMGLVSIHIDEVLVLCVAILFLLKYLEVFSINPIILLITTILIWFIGSILRVFAFSAETFSPLFPFMMLRTLVLFASIIVAKLTSPRSRRNIHITTMHGK